VLLLRAGMILGPYEDVARLPWWLDRISRGGRVVAPGRPERGLQYVDVRDLARFALDGLEQELAGPYDITACRATPRRWSCSRRASR
jgi:nucleoside-diphosphate-sugar epimerase